MGKLDLDFVQRNMHIGLYIEKRRGGTKTFGKTPRNNNKKTLIT